MRLSTFFFFFWWEHVIRDLSSEPLYECLDLGITVRVSLPGIWMVSFGILIK